MPSKTREELLETKIGRRPLRDWNEGWEPLANAFVVKYPHLYTVIGLIRIKLNGKTNYIICASDPKGGISKALQRIKTPKKGESFGPKKIRENIKRVKVEILPVPYEANFSDPEKEQARKNTGLLKRKMVNLYDPIWNYPFKKYMALMRDLAEKAKGNTKKEQITKRVIQLRAPTE